MRDAGGAAFFQLSDGYLKLAHQERVSDICQGRSFGVRGACFRESRESGDTRA